MIESASHSLEIPSRVPFMMMGPTVLFPHAMMPLYIFEMHYRSMLQAVLGSHRMFAVAAVDRESTDSEERQKPESVGSLGVVRACKQAEDGTYNLILQGLARVRLSEVEYKDNYPTASIENLETVEPEDTGILKSLQERLTQLIEKVERERADVPPEMLTYLHQVDDPEILLDLAIYTLCPPSSLKQTLLETLELSDRYRHFIDVLESSLS